MTDGASYSLVVPDLEVLPFRFADQRRVAEVVRDGFVGSVDAEMSECYASSEGCLSFVEGVTMRNGCGNRDTQRLPMTWTSWRRPCVGVSSAN